MPLSFPPREYTLTSDCIQDGRTAQVHHLEKSIPLLLSLCFLPALHCSQAPVPPHHYILFAVPAEDVLSQHMDVLILLQYFRQFSMLLSPVLYNSFTPNPFCIHQISRLLKHAPLLWKYSCSTPSQVIF